MNRNAWILLAAITAVPAQAAQWSGIVVCESGAAVVDVDVTERRNLQLVLRGDELLGRLHRAGMVGLNYGQREYVIKGAHAELRQVSATATRPVSLGGVFYPWDFRKLIADQGQGSTIEIERRGSELVLKRLSVASGYSCDGYIDGYSLTCSGNSIFHQTYSFVKEYILRGCSEL